MSLLNPTKEGMVGNIYVMKWEDVVLGSVANSPNAEWESKPCPGIGAHCSFSVVRKAQDWTTDPTTNGFSVELDKGGFWGGFSYWDKHIYAGISSGNFDQSFPAPGSQLSARLSGVIAAGWSDDNGFGFLSSHYQFRWTWTAPSDGDGEAIYDIYLKSIPFGTSRG